MPRSVKKVGKTKPELRNQLPDTVTMAKALKLNLDWSAIGPAAIAVLIAISASLRLFGASLHRFCRLGKPESVRDNEKIIKTRMLILCRSC